MPLCFGLISHVAASWGLLEACKCGVCAHLHASRTAFHGVQGGSWETLIILSGLLCKQAYGRTPCSRVLRSASTFGAHTIARQEPQHFQHLQRLQCSILSRCPRVLIGISVQSNCHFSFRLRRHQQELASVCNELGKTCPWLAKSSNF